MKGRRNSASKHLAVKYIIEELNQVYDEVDDEVRKEYLKGALEILNDKEVSYES